MVWCSSSEQENLMKYPEFADLAEIKESGSLWRSYAMNPSSNPRSYKYYWWVFWKGSQMEGKEFLSDENRLSFAKAMRVIRRLEEENECYILYNRSEERRVGKECR